MLQKGPSPHQQTILVTVLGRWRLRMGQTGAISLQKRCKSCLAIYLTPFLCVYSTVLLTPDICDAQTKRRRINPWCGDGVGVLNQGAAGPYVMLWAKAAAHHGWTIFWANCASRGGGLVSYIGPLCRINTKHEKNLTVHKRDYSCTILTLYSNHRCCKPCTNCEQQGPS